MIEAPLKHCREANHAPRWPKRLWSCRAAFCFVFFACCWFTGQIDGQELKVKGVPEGAPYTIRATATAVDLNVTINLDPGFHAYSRDVGGGLPVQIRIDEKSGFSSLGTTQFSESKGGKLEGVVNCRIPLTRQKADAVTIDATMDLQVCDALSCELPVKIQFSGDVPRIRVLLVATSDKKRTTRLKNWLDTNHFESTVVDYESVSREECDKHDVVIADSFRIMEQSLEKAHIRQFPKSETPIIGVGYIGTALVKEHGLAMTSGYI